MEFFDSHSHYNDEKFEEDREELIHKIYQEGITKTVVAGYDVLSSKKAISLAEQYHFIYATCGISPNDIPGNTEEIFSLAKQDKVVAIGEIGLDYYWNKENKKEQKETFCEQIEIANQLRKPIVIHARDAVQDIMEVLKEKPVDEKGVFHCIQLNPELVKQALKLDFFVSFAGSITFRNSKNADEIIKMVPLEKMLIETDCPYLAPEPVRGTRNDSRNVKYTAQKIAQVKQKQLEEIAKITYQNAETIFKINK